MLSTLMVAPHDKVPALRKVTAPALLALVATGFYLLLHPYRGIYHDARLYTLQALNQLHPELYGADIFLRFGSQDDYSLFAPLHAWVIAILGVEPGAAALTLVGTALFLFAAWHLARQLSPRPLYWFSLGLLVVLPDHYGHAHVFSYLEEFITPRTLAQALALLGLTAWLARHRMLSCLLLAAALLIHPLMALPAIALLLAAEFVLPHWRRFLAAMLAITALAGIISLVPTPLSRWQIDSAWLQIIVGRAPYLFVECWSPADWGRVVTVATTLSAASLMLQDQPRRIAASMLVVCATGLALTAIGGDLLRIAIVVQAQPWRVLWLATVLAVILLPALSCALWRGTALQRCGLLLLAASWLAASHESALWMSPLALGAIVMGKHEISGRHARLLYWGCGALLALAILEGISLARFQYLTDPLQLTDSRLYDKLRNASLAAALPICIGGLATWAALRLAAQAQLALIAILALPVVWFVAIPGAQSWLHVRYDPELKAAFSEWRRMIPEGSEVLWIGPDLDEPADVWLLLERASYLTRTQTVSALFSRQAAFAMLERSRPLARLVPGMDPFQWSPKQVAAQTSPTLEDICMASPVRYIATTTTLDQAPHIATRGNPPPPYRDMKLYICS